MENPALRLRGSGLPALPSSVRTKDGVIFDPTGDHWVIHSLHSPPARIRFDRFSRISDGTVHRLKLILINYLQRQSFSHFRNLYQRFDAFYRAVLSSSSSNVVLIEIGHICSYRAILDRKTEWKLATLRVLLVEMHEQGLGITSSDALDYLHDATFRGNIKGTSVRTRDANQGAFNDVELLSIQTALNNSYAEGRIDLSDFAAAWVLLAYGVRPIQIAALKECDLTIDGSDGSDGALRYQLRMPRAKQRGAEIRGSFKNRYCSKQLGQILESLIAQNGERYGHLRIPQIDRPMFWSTSPGELPRLQHHVVAQRLSNRIATVIADLTGLKANAKRFRITLGQRSADNGVDKHTLAELLDHSDTQNVHVYYEASPEMALRLDKHLAMDMAPLAQAFAGVVVTTDGDGPKGAGNQSKIYDRSLANNVDVSLGDCGQMSFCGLSVPFACYTCRHFKPWIDGPHEAFLEALVADRERMIAEAIDSKIYTIRDRTILAVAEVVQLCEGMREEQVP